MINIEIARPSGKEPIPLGSGIITRLLGDGGMASVYEIWNQQLEVHRAVKLLHPNCSKETLERFQTEIKITAKMHHPNIIEIHGVGEWNGIPYFEMEKADGVTLEQLINMRGALPSDVSLAIGIMVSRALDYAHNHEYTLYNNNYHGVIHRDLKPGNIMVCKDGVVKLMDFGIARPATTSFHTVDGAIIGTLQYLSPEQLEGYDLDFRTDIYSFGICLYEMVCGHLAFPENNISYLLADKSKNRFKPLSSYEIKLPVNLVDIIQCCMTHDKIRRPQSASMLGNELNKIYDKCCSDKPEAVVKAFIGLSCTDRVLPKITSYNTVISKRNMAIIILSIIILYIIIVISNRDFQKNRTSSPIALSGAMDSATKSKPQIISDSIFKDTVYVRDTAASIAKTVKNKNEINIQKKPEPAKSQQSIKSNQKEKEPDIFNLKTKYDTDDLLLIAQKEIGDRNFSNALAVLKYLDPRIQKTTRAQILKARALVQVDYRAYSTFILSLDKFEAELLIYKAKFLIESGNLSNALSILDRASTAPCDIISS